MARAHEKRAEYAKEAEEAPSDLRWANLAKHVPEDGYFAKSGAILDYARVAITVKEPGDLARAVRAVDKNPLFEVTSLKNGYSPSFEPPSSGYRHLAVLARFALPRRIDAVAPEDYGRYPKGTSCGHAAAGSKM